MTIEQKAKNYAWNYPIPYSLYEKIEDKKEQMGEVIEQTYIAGATENTALLSQHILELQADKGRLIDEIKGQKEYIKYLKRQRQGGIQKQYNKVGKIKDLEKQLNEAKEIISAFIKWIKEISSEYYLLDENEKEMVAKAEAFLKEESK